MSGGTALVRGETDGRRATTITVYGRVPGGQRVPPGPYADNLAVSLHLLTVLAPVPRRRCRGAGGMPPSP